MELDVLLSSLKDEDSNKIKVLLKEYVKPLSILTNFILTTKTSERLAENEYQTIVRAAKYDGVVELILDIGLLAKTLEDKLD